MTVLIVQSTTRLLCCPVQNLSDKMSDDCVMDAIMWLSAGSHNVSVFEKATANTEPSSEKSADIHGLSLKYPVESTPQLRERDFSKTIKCSDRGGIIIKSSSGKESIG